MRWLDLLFAAAVLAATFCGRPAARADDFHWIGAGTGGNTATDPANPTTQWNNPANWQEAAAPGPGDTPLLPLANAGYVYAQSGQVSGLLVNGPSAQGAYHIGDGADVTMPPSFCLAAGYSGMGRVLQTGGSLTTIGVVLGGWDVSSGWGSYELQGGTLAVTGTSSLLDIGYRGTGVFTQTGGTASVQGAMYVGRMGGNGMLNVGGGTLRVGGLYVGDASSTGALKISNAETEFQITKMYFGPNSTFTAVPGTAIRVVGIGPLFFHSSTDESALEDLEQVTMIFGGDDKLRGALFEVAGRDFGPTSGAFAHNFTLGSLVVGDAYPVALYLRDDADNGNRSSAEALYVHNLAVGPGSTLNLGGLNLYYDGWFVNQGTVVGGSPVYVPEPCTMALIGAGLGLLVGFR